MSSTKIINAILLAAAVAAVAWGLSLLAAHPSKPAEFVHVLPGTQAAGGDYVYTEGDQYYTIEAHYPATTTLAGAADAAARRSIEQGVLNEINGFHDILNQTLSADEKARLAESGRQYAFAAEYQSFSSAHFYSLLYSLYEDTGGAHPNGYFKTFVYDQQGAPVMLPDLFTAGSDYLRRLSQTATAAVRQQLGERLGADAVASIFSEGLAPAAENYQNFTIEGDELHIYFPPYQVAAYAAGTFDVAVPLGSLADILKPGVR
jgi:hypothetical protein